MPQSRSRRSESDAPTDQDGPGGELPPEESLDAVVHETSQAGGTAAGQTIKLGGREYSVDPALAAALEAREQEFSRKLTDQGKELGELRQWRRTIEGRPPPAAAPALTPTGDPNEYYETALFERPKEAIGRLRKEIREEVTRDLVGYYDADQQRQRFWVDFYKKHDDLTNAQLIVERLYEQMAPQWAHEPVSRLPDFIEELAKDSRQYILALTRQAKVDGTEPKPLPTGRARVEAGGGVPAATPTPTPEPPTTLASLVQARRAARGRA